MILNEILIPFIKPGMETDFNGTPVFTFIRCFFLVNVVQMDIYKDIFADDVMILM